MYATPMTLNSVCAMAARLASRFVPMAASCAVMVVPMSPPSISVMAAGKLMRPLKAMTCTMAIVALELCMSIVTSMPTRTPSIGLSPNRMKISFTCWLCLSGSKASFMNPSPMKRRPKPMRTCPQNRAFLVLPNMLMPNPIPTAGSAYWVTLKTDIEDTSHAVTVVPMLAPIITLIACFRTISPALTKPITMTVVALEDWISPVIIKPTIMPIMGSLVTM